MYPPPVPLPSPMWWGNYRPPMTRNDYFLYALPALWVELKTLCEKASTNSDGVEKQAYDNVVAAMQAMEQKGSLTMTPREVEQEVAFCHCVGVTYI